MGRTTMRVKDISNRMKTLYLWAKQTTTLVTAMEKTKFPNLKYTNKCCSKSLRKKKRES